MKIEPVAFIFDGRAMIPLDRFRDLARRQFRAGQEYALIPHQPRSSKAQGLFFKAVQVAWENLPEQWQKRRDTNRERFPTANSLRKWALVQEGFADEHVTVCDTPEDAQKVAALARTLDEFAVIVVHENIVTVWVAQHQDAHTMDRDTFQRSMDKVMGRLAHMLGISSDDLAENAKSAMVRRKENA